MFFCFSQEVRKENIEGREGCSEASVIVKRPSSAFIIAAELLFESLSSCSRDISGDCNRVIFCAPFLVKLPSMNDNISH